MSASITTTPILFSREWAMPSRHTFEVKPIGAFVDKHLRGVSVDPFCGRAPRCTHNNDIGFGGIDAAEFLDGLVRDGIKCDTLVLDPPYSPRQISECYKHIGRKCTGVDTQSAALYKRVKDAAIPLLNDGATVLTFGWNTVGMGKNRGCHIEEILLVCHGGAHNDTICVMERFDKSSIATQGGV